jgi:hypothetical protein
MEIMMKSLHEEIISWLVVGNFIVGTICFVLPFTSLYVSDGMLTEYSLPIALLVILIVFFDIRVAFECKSNKNFSIKQYFIFVITIPILCTALFKPLLLSLS